MLLAVVIMQINARVLPEPNPIDIVSIAPVEHLEPNPSASLQFSDHYELMNDESVDHYRQKRAVYDPYAVYYYYPTPYNPRPAYYESYINRRDTNDNRITENGPKYKYTPLFQYKSTQSRRRKLFVPNLFG